MKLNPNQKLGALLLGGVLFSACGGGSVTSSVQASSSQGAALPVVVATSTVRLDRLDTGRANPPVLGALMITVTGPDVISATSISPVSGMDARLVPLSSGRNKLMIYAPAGTGIPSGAVVRLGFSSLQAPNLVSVSADQAADSATLAPVAPSGVLQVSSTRD